MYYYVIYEIGNRFCCGIKTRLNNDCFAYLTSDKKFRYPSSRVYCKKRREIIRKLKEAVPNLIKMNFKRKDCGIFQTETASVFIKR